MGSDLVVALGAATANGLTPFGANSHRPAREAQVLKRVTGRQYSLGEVIDTGLLKLPQCRQTYTVLGSGPPGTWGFCHGVNEHHVAAGCATWKSRLRGDEPGLLGTDLVRLTLERSRTARQGLDVLADLIGRHGQGHFPGCSGEDAVDNAFLVADGSEAFVIEAASNCWASLECRSVRAVSDVALIRQDWQRLSPGLADAVIHKGWHPDDGSKLDFAGSLSAAPPGDAGALKRWGRATLFLEQRSGSLDADSIRRLLGDHFDGTASEVDPLDPTPGSAPICRHAQGRAEGCTAMSLLTVLSPDCKQPPVAWFAFGPPCVSVYFPILFEGDLPAAFCATGAAAAWSRQRQVLDLAAADAERWAVLREEMGRLQARFDLQAEEFAIELARQGENTSRERLAGLFMQNHLEQFEAECQRLQKKLRPRPVLAGSDSPGARPSASLRR
jgi:secernin